MFFLARNNCCKILASYGVTFQIVIKSLEYGYSKKILTPGENHNNLALIFLKNVKN